MRPKGLLPEYDRKTLCELLSKDVPPCYAFTEAVRVKKEQQKPKKWVAVMLAFRVVLSSLTAYFKRK